jgi:hypothetical protein
MMQIRWALVSTAIFLCGCSSPKLGNVVPQAEGKYEIVASSSSNAEALKSALYSAEGTCKKRNMRHVVLSQSSAYKGVVAENTNKSIDTAAKILSSVTGKWIPSLSGAEDYQVKLEFACEPAESKFFWQ